MTFRERAKVTKDFSPPHCTGNPILAWILFQTSLWAWEPNKVIHWGTSEAGRGWSWNLNRRSGTELTLGAGCSQEGPLFTWRVVPWGSRRNVGDWRNKHTPRDIKAVFPNGHNSWAWLLFTPQVITRLQSQIWGLNPTSVLYKLCDLGQLT